MNNLAFGLESGDGIELDLQDARRYYAQAMELKHPEAERNAVAATRWTNALRSSATQENLPDHGLPRLHSTKLPPLAFLPEIRDPRSDADLTPICALRSVSSKFARDARLVIPALAASRKSGWTVLRPEHSALEP
jgi:hypothetical protein